MARIKRIKKILKDTQKRAENAHMAKQKKLQKEEHKKKLREERKRRIKLLKELLDSVDEQLNDLANLYASFEYAQLSVASSEKIRSWATRYLPIGKNTFIGRIFSPETLDFKEMEPVPVGLFSQQLFGPIVSYTCACKIHQHEDYSPLLICEYCLVELTDARARRYRMAYVELATPITHFWYFSSSPNYIRTLLAHPSKLEHKSSVTQDNIKEVIYYRASDRKKSENSLYHYKRCRGSFYYWELSEYSKSQGVLALNLLIASKGRNAIKFFSKLKASERYGSEIIKAALEDINVKERTEILRAELLEKPHSDNAKDLLLFESFLATKTHPSYLVFTTLPVLPPGLRPLIELEDGLLASSDHNEMYRQIILKNNNLSTLTFANIPLSFSGRRALQQAVDVLIDNARVNPPNQLIDDNKPLKSLTEILEGKEGRFRQNLLGKRVNYSARSVIIVNPLLRVNECALPFEMALKLFEPFLLAEIGIALYLYDNQRLRQSKRTMRPHNNWLWPILVTLCDYYSVFLNRAPTLHKFNIQAFDPLPVLGKAIHLHPLVCTGFNADFDGDQMAVHLPLYKISQLEIKTMMKTSTNILAAAKDDVMVKPTQDMIIGSYYLSLIIPLPGALSSSQIGSKIFANPQDVFVALENKILGLQSPIFVRFPIVSLKFCINLNNKLVFSQQIFPETNEILFSKMLFSPNCSEKIFFITNIGILVGYSESLNSNYYYLTDTYLYTTPGRLIFTQNISLSN